MSQGLSRKTLSVFGLGGTTDDFEEFGSTANGSTVYTKDIETIQGLSAWTDGWRPALVTAKAPILQDMNAVWYVHSYEIAYLLQEGIAEYDAATTYDYGSVVKLPYNGSINSFQIFVSISDANVGNALPTAPASNSYWQFVYGFVSGAFTMGTSISFGSTSTEGIVGSTTNDSAAAGNVGEAMRSDIVAGSAVSLTSNTWGNVTSLALTAGDWDVTGVVMLTAASASLTTANQGGALSLYSGNTTTDHVIGDNVVQGATVPISTLDQALIIPAYRVSLGSPATLYMKALQTFSGGTAKAYGRVSARRMR